MVDEYNKLKSLQRTEICSILFSYAFDIIVNATVKKTPLLCESEGESMKNRTRETKHLARSDFFDTKSENSWIQCKRFIHNLMGLEAS